MRLAFIRQHRIGLDFAYHIVSKASAQLVARGFQEIGCMRAEGETLFAIAPPSEMINALYPFMARQP
jgi:enediyne biosynthesis thioesterase